MNYRMRLSSKEIWASVAKGLWLCWMVMWIMLHLTMFSFLMMIYMKVASTSSARLMMLFVSVAGVDVMMFSMVLGIFVLKAFKKKADKKRSTR